MGRLDFSFDTEFMKKLGTMAEVERFAPMMIDEALPIVQKALISNLGRHKRSGSLAGSIKIGKAKKIKNGGYYGTVAPKSKDKRDVSNAEKLIYMEYGTSRQSATPVIGPAVESTRDAVNRKMKEVFEREALK